VLKWATSAGKSCGPVTNQPPRTRFRLPPERSAYFGTKAEPRLGPQL
jgi:hypothetical protein